MTDFETRIKDQLRSEEASLDPGVAFRLREARRQALTEPRHPLVSRLWLPVAGMAMASVVAFVVFLSPAHQVGPFHNRQVANEPALMQDLDFYYWLSKTETVSES